MVTAILFDCFGVLTTDNWLAFVSSLPDGTDVQALRDLNRAYGAGMIDRKEFLAGVQKVTGRDPREVQQLLEDKIHKNRPLLQYIATLRQRGYKIGLLSNVASNWVRERFLSPEEQELFDQMVMSFEVGIVKPDPRIYMLACERLRVSPQETVFIDDIASYCNAAREIGMKAIVYQNFKQAKSELEALLEA